MNYGVIFCFLFSLTTSIAQTNNKQITEATNFTALKQLKAAFQQEDSLATKRIASFLKQNRTARKQIEKDGTLVDLVNITKTGIPIYYQTNSSATSKVTRADTVHENGALALGLSGENMKIGVWDAGKALETHREFNNRVVNTDGDSELDSHTTLVTGVIAAEGIDQDAKGIAYKAEVLSNDWRLDRTEVIDAAMEGLLVSNHSYGIRTSSVPDWYFGAYLQISKNWDEIMYNAPYYLMVSAGGNARNSKDNLEPNFGTPDDGYDLMLGFNTSKNGMVVTAANAKVDASGDLMDSKITAYTSFGPVDDGRIKPDIAGDGASIYSTGSSNDNSYGSSMGTSMAAPGVAGSLLLLQEYHQKLYGSYMRAATLKGLALHTADDVFEPGPDYQLGWGIINTKRAAEVLQANAYTSIIEEQQLVSGDTYSFEVTANELEALKVSISWTDPEQTETNKNELNSRKAALINDLDIRLTQNGTTYYPWKLDPAQVDQAATQADNWVDPYEQVFIDNPQGVYTVTISHKGTLKNEVQDYSILVSGIKMNNCQLTAPKNFQVTALTNDALQLGWQNAEDTLFELQLKDATENEWTTVTQWDNSFEVNNLIEGQRYSARVRGVCNENLTSEFSEELHFIFEGEATQVFSPSTENKTSLVVYPNPTSDEIRIANPTTNKARYYVSNMSGFIVKEGALESAIQVSDLPTGTYVVNVYDEEFNTSGKFIKR